MQCWHTTHPASAKKKKAPIKRTSLSIDPELPGSIDKLILRCQKHRSSKKQQEITNTVS